MFACLLKLSVFYYLLQRYLFTPQHPAIGNSTRNCLQHKIKTSLSFLHEFQMYFASLFCLFIDKISLMGYVAHQDLPTKRKEIFKILLRKD